MPSCSKAESLTTSAAQDVSGLFPDVLKNMQSEDLEQKKLVYLYLMNYAKSHPDLVSSRRACIRVPGAEALPQVILAVVRRKPFFPRLCITVLIMIPPSS